MANDSRMILTQHTTMRSLLLILLYRSMLSNGFVVKNRIRMTRHSGTGHLSSSSMWVQRFHRNSVPTSLRALAESPGDAATATTAPNLDGKRVLPYKVTMGGIQGHRVVAVYAVLNGSYQRGTSGWDACEHIGVSQDLAQSLTMHLEKHGSESVAYVRPLTFAVPDPTAMAQIAKDWRHLANEAGAKLKDWGAEAIEFLDDDDDDSDDEFETAEGLDEAELLAKRRMEAEGMVYIRPKTRNPGDPVASPFNNSQQPKGPVSEGTLDFTQENVDKVLNEVRPYLIADGGNVKVERVDEIEKNVYLKLEGACGSCESSTVTMQMGIERTLRENFADLKEVIRVDADTWKPTELTMKAVEDEVNRLKPAILAMGGQCEIVYVDSVTGVVDLKFRGAAKVRQGLELALLDVPLLNKVNFLMGDD